jgi:hypothetical protein
MHDFANARYVGCKSYLRTDKNTTFALKTWNWNDRLEK